MAAEAAYALGKLGAASARPALEELLRRADAAAGRARARRLRAARRLAPAPRRRISRPWPAGWPRPTRSCAGARPTPSLAVPTRARSPSCSPASPTPTRASAPSRCAASPRRSRTPPASPARSRSPRCWPARTTRTTACASTPLRGLGTFAAPEAVDLLARRLGGEQPQEALTAAESLGRLGSAAAAATAPLAELASDSAAASALRAAALDALAAVDPARARDLAAALSGAADWRLRAAAGRVPARLPDRADELRARLADRDPRVVANVLLAAIDDAGDSLAPLRSLLVEESGHPDVIVRAEAIAALGRLRDPALLPLLLDAYQRARADTLDDAALAALDALGGLRSPTLAPERALFARFPRPDDSLLRLRAAALFGDAAREAWGEPLPIDTGLGHDDYRRLVERWVAPHYRGAPLPRARIETDRGAIDLVLLADQAPLTVASLARLAARGYFDGQRWPRVVPNFVVQGGDPRGDTSGGPGYSIRDEINRERYAPGSLGMALAGPDTGGSQFFVTHSAQPHLDGTYTLFGRTVAGLEVTHRLLPGDRILSIRVLP